MSKRINMIGKKFGKLTVLEELLERDKFGNKMYKCMCDCGNFINVRGACLRVGNNKSCGCLRGVNHGKRKEPLYWVWCSIKQRCNNPNNHRYKDWGERGITMCDEWFNNFQAFYDWAMSNGYCKGLTIDRIDNNKGYEPSNCRLVDKKTQNRNKRNNRIITIDNETHCLSEWCEILNLNYCTVEMRLCRGWTIEKAFELEVK